MPLTPTLWRTCRVLANPLRLRCLQAVLRQPNRFVSALAQETRLPVPVASQYLRDLQARGLISVWRRSRWTFYGDTPDPLVDHAAPLLAAMRKSFADETFSMDQIHHVLQGFTHPRRLAVLRVLVTSSHPSSFAAIGHATGISAPALVRHLHKLEACELVRRVDRDWCLAGHLPGLARRLLREVGG